MRRGRGFRRHCCRLRMSVAIGSVSTARQGVRRRRKRVLSRRTALQADAVAVAARQRGIIFDTSAIGLPRASRAKVDETPIPRS